VRRLQEYERFKQAAEDIDSLPRVGRDLYPAEIEVGDKHVAKVEPQVELREVLVALAAVLKRAELFSHHQVEREPLSVRERMSQVLSHLRRQEFTEFDALFTPEEGRAGVVVAMLAVLELLKATLIEIVQSEPYGPIHVRSLGEAAEE